MIHTLYAAVGPGDYERVYLYWYVRAALCVHLLHLLRTAVVVNIHCRAVEAHSITALDANTGKVLSTQHCSSPYRTACALLGAGCCAAVPNLRLISYCRVQEVEVCTLTAATTALLLLSIKSRRAVKSYMLTTSSLLLPMHQNSSYSRGLPHLHHNCCGQARSTSTSTGNPAGCLLRSGRRVGVLRLALHIVAD